jgi:hypothetical protein
MRGDSRRFIHARTARDSIRALVDSSTPTREERVARATNGDS